MGKLTVREMQALTSSEVGKRLTDEHALFGVVRARGDAISVFFRWRYPFDGKVKDYTCGTWPKDSLANVRKARADAYGCLISGLDPNQRVRTHKLAAKAAQAEEMAKVIGRIEEAESLRRGLPFAVSLIAGKSWSCRRARMRGRKHGVASRRMYFLAWATWLPRM